TPTTPARPPVPPLALPGKPAAKGDYETIALSFPFVKDLRLSSHLPDEPRGAMDCGPRRVGRHSRAVPDGPGDPSYGFTGRSTAYQTIERFTSSTLKEAGNWSAIRKGSV